MVEIREKILKLMGEDIKDYYSERGEELPFDTEDIVTNREEIYAKHEEIEADIKACGFRAMTNNCFELRTLFLEDFLKTDADFDENKILLLDVNLSAIAEYLGEITLEDIEANLMYYGSWEIISKNGMNYLIDNSMEG